MTIVPGWALMETGVSFNLGIGLLIFYLLIGDFFQVLLRTNYQRGNLISLPIYLGKIVVSLILIWILSIELSIQHGIILLAYEVFQFLVFSRKYHYFEQIMYSLTNAFFKGIIFNLLISLHMPQTFQLLTIQPYIFSFTVILCLTFLTQALEGSAFKRKQYVLLSAITGMVVVSQLLWLTFHQKLAAPLLVVMIVLLIASTVYYIWEHPLFRSEFALQIGGLSLILIYYLVIL